MGSGSWRVQSFAILCFFFFWTHIYVYFMLLYHNLFFFLIFNIIVLWVFWLFFCFPISNLFNFTLKRARHIAQPKAPYHWSCSHSLRIPLCVDIFLYFITYPCHPTLFRKIMITFVNLFPLQFPFTPVSFLARCFCVFMFSIFSMYVRLFARVDIFFYLTVTAFFTYMAMCAASGFVCFPIFIVSPSLLLRPLTFMIFYLDNILSSFAASQTREKHKSNIYLSLCVCINA